MQIKTFEHLLRFYFSFEFNWILKVSVIEVLWGRINELLSYSTVDEVSSFSGRFYNTGCAGVE